MKYGGKTQQSQMNLRVTVYEILANVRINLAKSLKRNMLAALDGEQSYPVFEQLGLVLI